MNLDPRFNLGALDLTEYPYSIEFGGSLGSPQGVTEVLSSLLIDGELITSARTSNREITMAIVIEGPDLLAVAEAESALVAEASKPRNTLLVDPGDGFGVPTVFDTFRASVEYDRSDERECATLRRYVLTIPALPYGRSATLTVETAEGIPSVGETVNNCESLTGWSTPTPTVEQSTTTPESPAPTVLAVDSTVFVEGAGSMAVSAYRMWGTTTAAGNAYGPGFEPPGTVGWRLCRNEATLTQAIDLPTGAYVSFEAQFELPPQMIGGVSRGSVLDQVTVTSTEHGAVDVPLTSMIVETTSEGFARYTWRVAEPLSVTSIRWRGYQYRDTSATGVRPKMWIDNIAVAETATLGRQVLKSIEVGGSARTAGSIHVAAPSDSIPLGEVIAYTIAQSKVPLGFKPDLRQFAVPGATTTTDTTATNGSYYSSIGSSYGSAGSPVFEVPAAMFAGQAHTVMARVKASAGARTFGVEAGMFLDGVQVGSLEMVETAWTAPGGWEFILLDTLYLPTTPIKGASSDAIIRFRFKGTGPNLDELYVFPVEGDLTVLDCGTGTVGPNASSHAWIDAPSTEQPQGGYWRSATPTREDALAAWSTTMVPGIHQFEPETMLAFVASISAQGPSVSFEYYKRWFFHAAE